MRMTKVALIAVMTGAAGLGACGDEPEPGIGEGEVEVPSAVDPVPAPAVEGGAMAEPRTFDPALDADRDGALDPEEGLGDADGDGVRDRDEVFTP